MYPNPNRLASRFCRSDRRIGSLLPCNVMFGGAIISAKAQSNDSGPYKHPGILYEPFEECFHRVKAPAVSVS